MRLIFITLLFISSFVCFSQQITDLEVEYQEFHDVIVFNTHITFHATLYADSKRAIYKSYDDTEFSDKAFAIENAKPADQLALKKFSGDYISIDAIKNEMLFFDIIFSNHFLVKDVYHNFNWKISNETKTIFGYNCIKATTSYRGRDWIAWFAPEISVPFGPWKLHGLPGLILEAYDSKSEVAYKAVKIEFKKNDILTSDFTTLVKGRYKKPISYKQFLEERTEAFYNLNEKMQTENPNVTSSDLEGGVPRTGPELKYEWE